MITQMNFAGLLSINAGRLSDCQRIAKRGIPEAAGTGEKGIYRFFRRNPAAAWGGPAGYGQPVRVQTGCRRNIQALFF